MKGLEFDPEKHIYTYLGTKFPSTTGLIKEFGLIDFSMVPPWRLEYKKCLGGSVDIACHYLDQGRLDMKSIKPTDLYLRRLNPKHDSIEPYIDAYRKFAIIHAADILHSKLKLASPKWKFAGEIDKIVVMEWKGRLYLVVLDTKCTWIMYGATGVQLAGYTILFKEGKKVLIPEQYMKFPVIRLGVQLKPTGNFHIEQYDSKEDETSFLSCIHLHYRKKQFNIKESDYADELAI